MRITPWMALMVLLAGPGSVRAQAVHHPDAGHGTEHPPHAPPSGTPGTTTGLCCCRVWNHGWTYTWNPAPQCTTTNGTCVTPDHCGT